MEFDEKSGKLGETKTGIQSDKLGGFIATHPSKPVVYVEWREGDLRGPAALRIESDGTIVQLNRKIVDLGGGGIAHQSVSPDGNLLGVVSYNGATFAVFSLDEDGSIAAMHERGQHEGSSINPDRQDKAYAHWIGFDPENEYVHVTDLGTDEIWSYRRDVASGELKYPLNMKFKVPAGSGPRHIAFDKNWEFAYVSEELMAGVTVLGYDKAVGEFQLVERVSTVGEGELETFNKVSHIELHPSGRFLYTANRGNDTIAVFGVNRKDGTLTPIEREATRGSFPRHFAVSPSGNWLLVANAVTNNVSVFRIQEDGSLVYNLETRSLEDISHLAIIP